MSPVTPGAPGRSDTRCMSERIRTSLETEFRSGTLRGSGRVENVGEGGLFVGTNTIPDEGDAVELSLRTPRGLEIELSGMVWWTRRSRGSQGASGFGLRILDEDGQELRSLLDSL